MYIPKYMFFTKGIGIAKDPLLSFELALRDAKIEKFNLVPVSSIVPPNIKFISLEEGLKMIKPGQIIFCVMARFTSNEEGKEIFASLGYAIPKDKNLNGYIFEKHGYFEERFINYSEKLAIEMLKTEYKNIEIEKSGEVFIKSKVKDYTTVLACAVFI